MSLESLRAILFPSPENHRAAIALLDLLKKRDVAAFIGAGVSTDAELPTWSDFMRRLHNKACALKENKDRLQELETIRRLGKNFDPQGDGDDYLWRAEEYRRFLPKYFDRIIQQTFGDSTNRRSRTAEALVRLPFLHFVTTNYDDVIQNAIKGTKGTPVTVNWSNGRAVQHFLSNTRSTDAHVLHLHGRHDDPKTIILSEFDYRRRYCSDGDTVRKLFLLFSTLRLVFVGFSLDDPDLRFILRSVTAAFPDIDARHFILMLLDDESAEPVIRRQFRGKFGIEPVFFIRGEKNRYEHLPNLLEALAHFLKESSPLPTLDDLRKSLKSVKTPDVTQRGEEIRKVVEKKRKVLDPDDPLKGFADGKSERDGVRMSATVRPTGDPDWFAFELIVEAKDRDALGSSVTFYLHPTFDTTKETVRVKNGRVLFEGYAWGAFTAAAETGSGIALEVDLAKIKNAPKVFRSR